MKPVTDLGMKILKYAAADQHGRLLVYRKGSAVAALYRRGLIEQHRNLVWWMINDAGREVVAEAERAATEAEQGS